MTPEQRPVMKTVTGTVTMLPYRNDQARALVPKRRFLHVTHIQQKVL